MGEVQSPYMLGGVFSPVAQRMPLVRLLGVVWPQAPRLQNASCLLRTSELMDSEGGTTASLSAPEEVVRTAGVSPALSCPSHLVVTEASHGKHRQ